MVTIKVKIPPESMAYLKQLSDIPQQVPRAVQRGLDRALLTIKGNVKTKRLSGSGPFPAGQHRLGTRTGTLKDSVYTSSVIRGNSVIGIIGSDEIYAGIHEKGALISAKNAPFLVFQVKGKWIRTKQVVIPRRAPFATEVESQESIGIVTNEVAGEVTKLAKQ